MKSRIIEQGRGMTAQGMCLNQRTASLQEGQDATSEAEFRALEKTWVCEFPAQQAHSFQTAQITAPGPHGAHLTALQMTL